MIQYYLLMLLKQLKIIDVDGNSQGTLLKVIGYKS